MAQNPKKDLSQKSDHFAIIFAAPILPGQSEGWRRFLQEMMELRRPEYEESRRRLGISGERAWIAETVNGHVVVVAVIASQPEQVLARLASSDLAIDRWYREQLLALQGFDMTKPLSRASPELVLEWCMSKNQDRKSYLLSTIGASRYESHPIQARKEKHPMSEENKAVSRRFHEAIAKGSIQALQEQFAPNYVAHFPGVPAPLDAGGFNQIVNVFALGFSESHFDIDDEFAVGDKVVSRWTYHAVHSGEFQGIPPTGKQVAMTGITILHIAGGTIVENTVELDRLGLLQQLGVVPPPPGQGG